MYKDMLDYSGLKKYIKTNLSEEQEMAFKEALDEELGQAFGYISKRHVELVSRIEDGDDVLEETYELVESIKKTVGEVKRLLKKHDKYSGYQIEDEYKERLRDKKLEMRVLKRLMERVSGEVERHRRTYLVPGEKLVGLKMKLTKELEMEDEGGENAVYFDSYGHELYRKQLEDGKGPMLRIRWKGPKIVTGVCEILRGDEVEASVEMSKDEIKRMLRCEDVAVKSNIKKGSIKQKKKDSTKRRSKHSTKRRSKHSTKRRSKHSTKRRSKHNNGKIKSLMKKYDLKPTLRTFNRTSVFKSKKLTVTLRSNVVFIKGTAILGEEEWPFKGVPTTDIERLSNTAVEVTGSASWLEQTLSDSKVQNAPGFNLFVHGSTVLFPEATPEVPAWPTTTSPAIFESDISYDASPPDTQIAIPVRVEPKAFFANERTFLSWIQFAVFLGGIGTAMVSLGDAYAYLCGVMLVGVAGIFSFYALYLFHTRALKIRAKEPGPYEEKVGPIVLIGIFVLVMVLSFVFKFPIKRTGLKQ